MADGKLDAETPDLWRPLAKAWSDCADECGPEITGLCSHHSRQAVTDSLAASQREIVELREVVEIAQGNLKLAEEAHAEVLAVYSDARESAESSLTLANERAERLEGIIATGQELTETQGATIERLEAALAKVASEMKVAEDERLSEQDDWEKKARELESKDDMYGWNFYKGMCSGATCVDLFYQRVRRAALAGLPVNENKDRYNRAILKAGGLLSMLSQGVVPSNLKEQALDAFNDLGDLMAEIMVENN